MNSPLTLIGLPVAIGVMMLGLGLGLTVNDFRRVMRYPRAAVAALFCQIVLLPGLCFILAWAFGLPGALAVGIMLLAASPGGTSANLYSYLFGGRVALNVSLTAINSALSVLTLPIVVNLSAAYFLPDGASIGLQFGKVLQVLAIVLIPVAIGMFVRAKSPDVARRLDRPVKVLAVAFLILVIAVAILAERDNLADYFVKVGLAVLTFNVLSLIVGFSIPRLVGVDRPAAIAAGFEAGIHNSALAITIALSPTLLNNSQMAIPAAVYGIIMYFTATAFGFVVTRGRKTPAVVEEATG